MAEKVGDTQPTPPPARPLPPPLGPLEADFLVGFFFWIFWLVFFLGIFWLEFFFWVADVYITFYEF